MSVLERVYFQLSSSVTFQEIASCSVLQCVAMCGSVLQCVAVCVKSSGALSFQEFVCCGVLQCVAVCCSVSQCVLNRVAH